MNGKNIKRKKDINLQITSEEKSINERNEQTKSLTIEEIDLMQEGDNTLKNSFN